MEGSWVLIAGPSHLGDDGSMFAVEVDTLILGLLVGRCRVLMKGFFCLLKMSSNVEGRTGLKRGHVPHTDAILFLVSCEHIPRQ